MPQREIEIILIRQLASCLVMPMFIVDGQGVLVFYNEPAERILGRRFEETGEMLPLEWASAWTPSDEGGAPLDAADLPLWVALGERRPAYRRFWIRALDGAQRHIDAVAFPLQGRAERPLGAVVIFWELGQ